MKVTAQEAGAILRRRAQALDREVREAEKDALSYAVKTAEKLSSGPLTTAALRAMGHPYRIGGSPPANPAIINVQKASGGFRDSWQTEGPRKQGAGLVSKLTNTAPYARFLFAGTSRMIMRPILDSIRSRTSQYRYRKLQDATRKALSGS
jgi:hypothetical protein